MMYYLLPISPYIAVSFYVSFPEMIFVISGEGGFGFVLQLKIRQSLF